MEAGGEGGDRVGTRVRERAWRVGGSQGEGGLGRRGRRRHRGGPAAMCERACAGCQMSACANHQTGTPGPALLVPPLPLASRGPPGLRNSLKPLMFFYYYLSKLKITISFSHCHYQGTGDPFEVNT